MTANLVFLGLALLIFGLYNAIFLGGFFRTAVYFGKPFIAYAVLSLLVIVLGEALHHVPGLEKLNAFGFEDIGLQLAAFGLGLAAFGAMTVLSLQKAVRRIGRIDL